MSSGSKSSPAVIPGVDVERRAGADLPYRLPQRVDLCYQQIRPAVEQVRSEEEMSHPGPIATIIRHIVSMRGFGGEAEGAALFRPTRATVSLGGPLRCSQPEPSRKSLVADVGSEGLIRSNFFAELL